MTMEWKVSFIYANPMCHSEEDVKDALNHLILDSDYLNDMEDLKIELIG